MEYPYFCSKDSTLLLPPKNDRKMVVERFWYIPGLSGYSQNDDVK